MNKDLIKLYVRSFLGEKAGRVPLQQFSSVTLNALKDDQMLVPDEDEISNEDET